MTSSETTLPRRIEPTGDFLRAQSVKRATYEAQREAWRKALEPKPHNLAFVYDTRQGRFFFPPKE